MVHRRACLLLVAILALFSEIDVGHGQSCSGQGPDVSRMTATDRADVTYAWMWGELSYGARVRNPDGTEETLTAAGSEFTYDFRIGVSTVYATLQDDGSIQCQFTVTVADEVPPVLTCSTGTLSFTTSERVTWNVSATDNSNAVTLTRTGEPDGLIVDSVYTQEGTYMVTFRAEDPSGNMVGCDFMVQIGRASAAPNVMGCPPAEAGADGNIRETASAQATTHRVTWTAPVAVPSVGVTRNVSRDPGSIFVIGSTRVLYTFTNDDDRTRTSQCNFYVIVSRYVDRVKPSVTCPSSFTVMGALNRPTTIVTWDYTPPTDDVAVENHFFSPASGTEFAGNNITTTVLQVAVDTSGNVGDCSFTVTVLANTDNDNPVFESCPSDFTHYVADGDPDDSVTWSPPTVFDASAWTLESTHDPPQIIAVGDQTIIYTARDVADNVAVCQFIITVAEDQDPPTITCPDNFVDYVTPLVPQPPVQVFWDNPAPLATDNSGIVRVRQSHFSGDYFVTGVVQTVMYTAVDTFGLERPCTFTVHILVDPAPVFNYLNNPIISPTEPGRDYGLVEWMSPHTTVTDENPEPGMNVAPTLNMPQFVSPAQFPIGDTNILYTATDSRGSRTEYILTITVVDREAPQLINCPTGTLEFMVFNSTFRSALVDWTPPTAQDNSGTVELLSNLAPMTLRPVGVYNVTYTARDRSDNTGQCGFTVAVRGLPGDDTGPQINGCPNSFNVFTDPGVDYSDEVWTEPTVVDNVDANPMLQSSHRPGHRFFIGRTEVSYTATDNSNNRVVCSFTITVLDEENPVFTNCPMTAFLFVDPLAANVAVKLNSITATDNSGTVSLQNNGRERVPVSNAVEVVVLEARDPSENVATCLVSVTLQQTTDVLTYPGQVSVVMFRGESSLPTDLSNIEADLNDVFRCSVLADDFVNLRITSNLNGVLFYDVSFYDGTILNQYSDRGRLVSRAIEAAFMNVLSGTPPRLFETGNEVQSATTFQLNVCEYSGQFTLVSDNADGAALPTATLTQEPTTSTASSLRQRIHLQLDRTFNQASAPTFISSVVLTPFTSGTEGQVVVDYVLVYSDESGETPPTEAEVNQFFIDQLRFDSALDYTELGNSDLFLMSPSAFRIYKFCSCNTGMCSVSDRYTWTCLCTPGFSGDRCQTAAPVQPLATTPAVTVAPRNLTTGQLIGIIAGAVGVLLLLLLICCCCFFFMFAAGPKGPPIPGTLVPYEEPVAYMPPRPRAIAYAQPPPYLHQEPYIHDEPFVEMYVPEPVQSSVVGYGAGPIIEEVDSYPHYKRQYIEDPYFM